MKTLQNEKNAAGVDYNVIEFESLTKLEQELDDLRLGSLARIEELIQLLIVNKNLATGIFPNLKGQVNELSDIAMKLRKI